MASVIMAFIYTEVNTQYSIKSALIMACSGLVMVQVAFLEPVPRLAPRPGMPIAALREPPRVLLADQLRLESRHARQVVTTCPACLRCRVQAGCRLSGQAGDRGMAEALRGGQGGEQCTSIKPILNNFCGPKSS